MKKKKKRSSGWKAKYNTTSSRPDATSQRYRTKSAYCLATRSDGAGEHEEDDDEEESEVRQGLIY